MIDDVAAGLYALALCKSCCISAFCRDSFKRASTGKLGAHGNLRPPAGQEEREREPAHSRRVLPALPCPAAKFASSGSELRPQDLRRPRVRFGEIEGAVVISSDEFLVARVPHGASSGPIVVSTNGHSSNPHQIKVAVPIAENLHPVTNPALDAEGNIYVSFSGSRGQKVTVAIYKIDTNYNVKPFVADLMNATSIAFDKAGQMYVSSRYDGTVYRIAPNGTMSSYAEGMGVATGIAFDRARKPLRRRPQRDDFQDRARPADFRVCHA